MSWTIEENAMAGEYLIVEPQSVSGYTPVATVSGFTRDHALSRACLMVYAPEIHRALGDLLMMCQKNLPEHLHEQLKPFQETLNKVSNEYEQRATRR